KDKERQAQQQADSVRNGLALLDAIEKIVFEDIALPGAQAELRQLDSDLARLLAPQSDAAQAQQRWDQARSVEKGLRDEEVIVKANLQNLKSQQIEASDRLARLNARIGAGLDERDKALAAH